jgi:Trypsin-co-occurring domain 2
LIELADVIQQLRNELDRARRASELEELRFELGPIDLEVTVGLEKDGRAGARIRFWVADINADGRLAASSTQRIRLTLRPSLTVVTDEGTSVSPPYVSGHEVLGER